MTVQELVDQFSFSVVAGSSGLGKEITGGYVSDLLSNVMGNAKAGSVWITMQGHQNVVAVATLAELAAILLTGDVDPDEDAISKAEKEGIPLLKTSLSAFEAVGRLYQCEIHGQ